MSQVTQPKVQFGATIRAHRMLVLAALLALLATAAVVLALVLTDTQSMSPVSDQPASAVRGDGGPEENATAATLGRGSAVPPGSTSAGEFSHNVNPSTGYASGAPAPSRQAYRAYHNSH
jgi:hypothetical protein